MNAGEYTLAVASLYVAAIDRAQRRERRERALDARAAIADNDHFGKHLEGLKD